MPEPRTPWPHAPTHQLATGGVQTVRLTVVNTTVPRSSLFGVNPNPDARYLVETDPGFTNYRQWLSSDYFLRALSIDPASVQNAWATASTSSAWSGSKSPSSPASVFWPATAATSRNAAP